MSLSSKSMKKTLIVIGDPMMTSSRYEPSLNRFLTYKYLLKKRGIETVLLTYEDVSSLRLPDITAKWVDALLFFPYNYWNSNIEVYGNDNRIYGDISFGKDYRLYLNRISRAVKTKYKNKHLKYINPPESCIIDRDKLQAFNALKRAGIKTPEIFKVKNVEGFDRLLKKNGQLYIKPRFGAMGKGITYADSSGLYTNFLFQSGNIKSRAYDYNWPAAKIANKNRHIFIQQLISRGFIFQSAVNPLNHKGRKFDIRVYVVNGKTPYLYAKSAPLTSFTTNWSQGGRIEKRHFLRSVLSEKEIKRIKSLSLKAARAIGLSFAGVDIIIDSHARDINVLEIQSFPSYERGFDLMRCLAASI
jgi:glutathione synthase/RimK-type ligase-like ATP-grasp enzyme